MDAVSRWSPHTYDLDRRAVGTFGQDCGSLYEMLTGRCVIGRDVRHHGGVDHWAGVRASVDGEVAAVGGGDIGGEPPRDDALHGRYRDRRKRAGAHGIGGDNDSGRSTFSCRCLGHPVVTFTGKARHGRVEFDWSGESCRELKRDRGHFLGGQGRRTEREGSDQQSGEPARRRPLCFQQHPGQERLEDLVAQRAVEAGGVERLGQGDIRRSEEPRHRSQRRSYPSGECRQLAHICVRGPKRSHQGLRVETELGQPVSATDGDASTECPQVERTEIELALRVRVRGVDQLEAAIASEPVEHVGPDAATDVVAGLDHLDGAAAPSKDAGALQPASPAPITSTSITQPS